MTGGIARSPVRATPGLLILISLLLGCGADGGSAATTQQAPAAGRSATSPGAQVLERALARHLERMEGVENYTMVQTVMGMETTVYFEREVVDGRPRYRSRVVSVAGQGVPAAPDEWEDLYDGFATYAERATLRGTETVDGHPAWALVIDDFSRLPGMGAGAEDLEGVAFSRATLFLDTASYVLRRMEVEGTMERDGEQQPVTVTGRFEDYRQVGSMLHAYRTVMSMDGFAPAMPAAEVEQARRNLAELRTQMASMPAAQRDLMQGMLQPQIEQLESMLGGGAAELVIEVRDVRINTGPPAGR
jgi:hypothetical protein